MAQFMLAVLLLSLSGCSIVMALSGTPEPQLGLLEIGMSCEKVESVLGSPAEVVSTKDGNQTALYIYERDNERSIIRAVIHFFLDVLTLGFWELPATVAEVKQGEQRRFPIVYDPNGNVLLLNEYGMLY